jgi:Ribosome associated membrane protein RAMP4
MLIYTQTLPRSIRNKNQKFDKNVTKRGNVPIGKAAERDEDHYPVSKGLIAFFLFVIVGSSVVQVLNLFRTSAPPTD